MASLRKFAVLLSILPSFESFTQQLSNEERNILMLQDQRSLGNDKLLSYLSHSNARLRYRAAIAFANIQDTSVVDALIPLLKDREEAVRAAASFALGQIGSANAQDALLELLRRENDVVVLSRVLEALGRVGDREALDAVSEFLPKAEVVKREQAMSVARFALKNVKSEASVWLCFDFLRVKDQETQWRALYALWRSAPLGVIDVEISKRRNELEVLTRSTHPYVRMHLSTLLGRSKSSDAFDLLQALDKVERSKNDWKVQVQLIRAYAASVQKEPELLERLIHFLDSPHPHVQIASLQALTSTPKEVVQNSSLGGILRQKLDSLFLTSKAVKSVQGEALVVIGKHFPEDLAKYARLLTDQDSSPLIKAKYLEGLSFNVSGKNLDIFLERLVDESTRVSMAAWDFVKRLFSPNSVKILQSEYSAWQEIEMKLYGSINTSLSRRDMGISTLVAGALADTSFSSVFQQDTRRKIVQNLIQAYEHFSSPHDVEAMQAILSTLGAMRDTAAVTILEKALHDPDRTVGVEAAQGLARITGRDYLGQVPKSTVPGYTDYDWRALDSLAASQKVLITTSQGEIIIGLLKEHAPFTVLSFVKLIKKSFFDGLSFHRVVPNFVVQGGDPRGDGWGGPGYSIRSEFSLVGYDRGTVGVASAGKDTEGCQFFVTHSPQPHLDGRYTIFAVVLTGMDVIDKLQIGDKILQMKFAN